MSVFLSFWITHPALSQTLMFDSQSASVIDERVTFTLSIEYPIDAQGIGEILDMTIFVNFDPAVLSFDGPAGRGSLVDDWHEVTVSNPAAGELIVVAFTGANGVMPGDSGPVVQLPFIVHAEADTQLTISAVDQLADFATRAGEFMFGRQTCLPDGDVNQDGSVTAADALCIFQRALGLSSCLDH